MPQGAGGGRVHKVPCEVVEVVKVMEVAVGR